MKLTRPVLRAFLFVVLVVLAGPAFGEQSSVPVPKTRPAAGATGTEASKPAKRSGLPKDEIACRKRLEGLGVRFSPVKRITGKSGCGIRYPVEISRLPGDVRLSGRTVLNCRTGEALALWTTKVAAPEAKKRFNASLKTIDQYASYHCRTRNSLKGTKLSEHAKGNAIDLGRFHMSDGRVVDVASRPAKKSAEATFLKALRDAGCTFFTTVLGPGSDPYHDTHFHFDTAKRRNGSRYCK
ncbi:extensin family protein [Hoeflea poritis]|uniref:Extensin family protein n=1 Tax=Hoeflea poritis TaxID=2993659 RepID=A0ABT4VJR1_9HYPH|nr:extensin family protein [Hoeflea poritis]MDA4844357.1 extensin family protein [Hoeflea poritis]